MRPSVIHHPTTQHLADLLRQERGHCVSIWMPTHQSGRKTNENPIRFKNLLRDAAEKLEQMGDSEEISARLQALAELEHDFQFWQHQDKGFALFACDQFEQAFQFAHAIEEGVTVADRFDLRHILPAVCSENKVSALALTWERARMFTADPHSMTEVENESFPATMDDLVLARDPEEQLQLTSHRAKGQGAGPSDVAMYHGHGEGEEKIEADRDAYLTRVGKRVADYMYQSNRELVLVATDEVAGHFRSTSEVEIAEHVAASPDGLDEQEFQSRVGEAAKRLTKSSHSELGERLGTALSQQLGSTDPSEIATAASRGRVDTLMLASETNGLPPELVNVSIRQTLTSGGQIVVLDEENPSHPIAAIYRY